MSVKWTKLTQVLMQLCNATGLYSLRISNYLVLSDMVGTLIPTSRVKIKLPIQSVPIITKVACLILPLRGGVLDTTLCDKVSQ